MAQPNPGNVGIRGRYGQQGVKGDNYAHGWLQSHKIKQNKDNWAKGYGISEYGKNTEQAGNVTLIPKRRNPDGTALDIGAGEWIDITMAGRIIPVNGQDGLTILDDDYYSVLLKEKQEEADYLDQVTRMLAWNGNDYLKAVSPAMYKLANDYADGPILPSNLASYPPNSVTLGEKLHNFRMYVVKPLIHTFVFASGDIPKPGVGATATKKVVEASAILQGAMT